MTTKAGTWRVVIDGGAVGELTVEVVAGGWHRVNGQEYHHATPLRAAIAHAAWSRDWPVREIVAPGEMTAAEQLAVVTAERDDARLMTQCNRDNWRLAGEQRDALARAVTEYRCEVDGIAAMPDAQEAAAALAALCSAPDALDAALAVARGER